jgi:hypothetical protein
MASGVATRPIEDFSAYRRRLDRNVFRSGNLMRPVFEAARKRRLDEIKVRINLLKGNIANQKQQLEARQEEAATLERGGQPVPKDLTGTIESLRAEIGVADQQIVRFRSELAATDLRFNMDVERFHILRPNIPRP